MSAAQAPKPVMIKRLVCLANSRKPQGRCIAGRELLGVTIGGWVRPVSARESEEVSAPERQYQDGSEPRLLDIIDVPLLKAKPTGHQQENWLLDPDPEQYWVRKGTFPYDKIGLLAEPAGPLWFNGHHTSVCENNYVPIEYTCNINDSLKLIPVRGLQLHVLTYYWRRVRADFSFSGARYSLWVTDPVIEEKYLAQADGVYNLDASYLTISLGGPYLGKCYKLVAAIIGRHP